jgi:hypothetical protein
VTLLDFLDRRDERRAHRQLLPVDFRGWLGFGLFVQSTFLFALIAFVPELRESQGFLTLASAVIVTGWIGGAAAFAYSAGKKDGEQSAALTKAVDLATQLAPQSRPDVVLEPGQTAQAREPSPSADGEQP